MEKPLVAPTRLRNFPISFFAMVMGLAGVTIAWEKAEHLLGRDLYVTTPLTAMTSGIFVILVLIYTGKFLRHRDNVLLEVGHPIKLNFFPTISISMLLLGIAFLPFDTDISRPLWMSGTLLHLAFTLYVVNVWMHHEHFEIQHLNPAWFIPAVGNVLVPVAGVPLGYTEISWFFFSIGMLFWVMLMTIIFYRMLFHHPLDRKLMPTLFILIAPPAVGFIAYMRLAGDLDAFARVLYYAGLFLTLLLLTQFPRFVRLDFFLSWWAYSFPLAAISIASMVMFEATGISFFAWTGGVLLVVLNLLVLMLLVRTAQAVMRRRICIPEH